MAEAGLAADNLQVVIEDDAETVRRDPVTGAIEIDQPDGGVVIQFNPGAAQDGEAAPEDPAEFYKNLAANIDEGRLNVIANDLFEAVQADDESRKETLAIHTRGLDLLGLELRDPSTSVGGDSSSALDGMSTVVNPLLLESCLKGWANAQAELLPAEGPCKIDNDGLTPTERDDELASALETGMNHYLTVTAREYVPDTSQMLLWGTHFRGSGFKKVFRCPLRRRPVSDSVPAEDLIVSDTTKDLGACARITHQIKMRQSVMKRMIHARAYRDVALTAPSPEVNPVEEKIAAIQGTSAHNDRPEDDPYTIWEIQCELDLPEFAPTSFRDSGVPLPYLVTMDKDTRAILAIRRDWKPEDDQCERKRMYVRYPYVPGPGFYGTGLLNILGNSSSAMTAAWREALDAGMFANFPAFLMSKLGNRQNTSDMRAGPAQGIPIETNGKPIQESVMEMPYKDVTPGLMKMMEMVLQQSKETAGMPDIPVGEGTANIPVGTMLSLIEQATKVMSAAHKGMHTAQSDELQLLTDLFREDPEAFWRWNKKQRRIWDEQKLLAALNTYTLVPKSDPNIPSHVHRIQRAVALVQLSGDPKLGARLDSDAILKRVLSAMKEPIEGLLLPPPPPADPTKDPKFIEATAKDKQGTAKIIDAKAKADGVQVRAAEVGLKTEQQQRAIHAEGTFKTLDLAKDLIKQQGEDRRESQRFGLDVSKHAVDTAQTIHEAAMRQQEVMNPPDKAS